MTKFLLLFLFCSASFAQTDFNVHFTAKNGDGFVPVSSDLSIEQYNIYLKTFTPSVSTVELKILSKTCITSFLLESNDGSRVDVFDKEETVQTFQEFSFPKGDKLHPSMRINSDECIDKIVITHENQIINHVKLNKLN